MISISHKEKQITRAKFLKMSRKASFNGGIITNRRNNSNYPQFATLWSSANHSKSESQRLYRGGNKRNTNSTARCLELPSAPNICCSSFYSTLPTSSGVSLHR